MALLDFSRMDLLASNAAHQQREDAEILTHWPKVEAKIKQQGLPKLFTQQIKDAGWYSHLKTDKEKLDAEIEWWIEHADRLGHDRITICRYLDVDDKRKQTEVSKLNPEPLLEPFKVPAWVSHGEPLLMLLVLTYLMNAFLINRPD